MKPLQKLPASPCKSRQVRTRAAAASSYELFVLSSCLFRGSTLNRPLVPLLPKSGRTPASPKRRIKWISLSFRLQPIYIACTIRTVLHMSPQLATRRWKSSRKAQPSHSGNCRNQTYRFFDVHSFLTLPTAQSVISLWRISARLDSHHFTILFSYICF
jgi:hypothetical protein